jgi:hypothetical protein
VSALCTSLALDTRHCATHVTPCMVHGRRGEGVAAHSTRTTLAQASTRRRRRGGWAEISRTHKATIHVQARAAQTGTAMDGLDTRRTLPKTFGKNASVIHVAMIERHVAQPDHELVQPNFGIFVSARPSRWQCAQLGPRRRSDCSGSVSTGSAHNLGHAEDLTAAAQCRLSSVALS